MLKDYLGEWLNGRVAVSKTVGCVFESRLPCQIDTIIIYLMVVFFYCKLTHIELVVSKTVGQRERIASPLPNRYYHHLFDGSIFLLQSNYCF